MCNWQAATEVYRKEDFYINTLFIAEAILNPRTIRGFSVDKKISLPRFFFSVEVFTIAGDDFLIPVERILFQSSERSFSLSVGIHIDESVALVDGSC